MSMLQFNSLVEAQHEFSQYEKQTKSAWRTSGVHGKIGALGEIKDLKKESQVIRIFWRHPPNKGCSVDFTGIPFIIVGRKDWNCHQGVDLDRSKKEKRRLFIQKHFDDENMNIKQRQRQASKKVGCPAMIFMLHIVRFPDYEISINSERNRKKKSQLLRRDILNDKPITMHHQFILKLPDPAAHFGHSLSVSASFRQSLDKRIRDKIAELVNDGVVSLLKLKENLAHFVTEEIFVGRKPPSSSNRRYYPTDRELENYLYRKDVSPHQSMVEILMDECTPLFDLNQSITRSLGEIQDICWDISSSAVLSDTDEALKMLVNKLKDIRAYSYNESLLYSNNKRKLSTEINGPSEKRKQLVPLF